MILNTSTTGGGPPVVLLHGLFGAAKNLGAIARGLAPHATILSLDLRNHGASPHDAAMDYPIMAADVAATMAAHNIEEACIIGHSMGGKTAMALALTHSHLVQKLVVMDIAPVTYDHAYDEYAKAMRDINLSPGLTRHAAEAALAPAVPAPPLRAFLLNNLILGEAPHWRIGLPEIEAALPDLLGWEDPPGCTPYAGPALFLRGANSDYVQPAAAAVIARLFPHAVSQSIPQAGHWLHAEQPAAVIAALAAFLFPMAAA